MFDKALDHMTDDELREELKYWQRNRVDQEWWRDITNDIINQLKINDNVRVVMAHAQASKAKQVVRDFDWKSTADIMVVTVFVFTMYLYMAHVVLN